MTHYRQRSDLYHKRNETRKLERDRREIRLRPTIPNTHLWNHFGMPEWKEREKVLMERQSRIKEEQCRSLRKTGEPDNDYQHSTNPTLRDLHHHRTTREEDSRNEDQDRQQRTQE